MLSRSDRGLTARTLPSGVIAVDLQGRFMSMAVATVGTGEKPAVNCAVTPEKATAVLQSSKMANALQGDSEQ